VYDQETASNLTEEMVRALREKIKGKEKPFNSYNL